MKTALFIGRFQPWHAGHYSVLSELVRHGFTHCIIGVGSAQYQRTQDNPLSYEERVWCMQTVLAAQPLELTVQYCALPDIHDNAAWVAHVNRLVYNITPHYDLVVSGNSLVQSLFTQAGVSVQAVTVTVAISGTELRQWIRQHDERWQQYLSSTIASKIVPLIEQTA